jgi:hypothetical protein
MSEELPFDRPATAEDDVEPDYRCGRFPAGGG